MRRAGSPPYRHGDHAGVDVLSRRGVPPAVSRETRIGELPHPVTVQAFAVADRSDRPLGARSPTAAWTRRRSRRPGVGYTAMSLAQLKILQEVITLIVFAPFAVLYMRQPLKLDYLWASLCLLGAVYFVFRSPHTS